MQLLSLHYTNIGPFQDQTVIVKPRFGSYLIKAPIGSGKSFLFFDGPVFGLYRKNSRPLLNMNSEKGELVCEFRLWDMQYCVQRTITKTKKWESISSKLWVKPTKEDHSDDSGIVMYSDIIPFEISIDYEVVEFKNETDLQKNLDEILPPKEVFLGTYFLLQDSDNIFELPPRERLEIFKHVFGLLWIDESKQKISDKKREISAIIKSRSDMSQYDQKLNEYLSSLVVSWNQIQEQQNRYHVISDLSSWNSFVQEQKLLEGKILIEQFSLPEIADMSVFREAIESQKQLHTQYTTQSQWLQDTIITLEKQLSLLRQQETQKTRDLQSFQQQVSSYDSNVFDQLTQKITLLQNQRDQFIQQCNLSEDKKNLQIFIDQIQEELREKLLHFCSHEPLSIYQLWSFLQDCISLGKDYKHSIELWEQKKTNLSAQIADITTQIIQAEQSTQQFEHNIHNQQQFHCDKIDGACPYVEIINTATFKTLRSQFESLQQQTKLLVDKKSLLVLELNVLSEDSHYKILLEQSEIIKKVLISSQRKLKQQQFEQLNKQDQEISQLQSQRSQLQQQQAKILTIKEQIIWLQSELQSLAQNIAEIHQSLLDTTQKVTEISQLQSQLISKSLLHQDSEVIDRYEQIVDRLQMILTEYKDNQLLVKQLKEQEKMLSDLYLVFSKELLLIVVQSNLPQIQDLMNMYLSQVVDYQLVMEIDKKSTSTESLELFVTVQDRYGTREVSALSGGQKVILKLVWMMAISVITNSQMLFLDETINNLDGDTVGRVADLLKNFIKGKGEQFQFYVVTHSHQIQDMDIWDGVIEIGSI